MNQFRIALAQINTTVGALSANANKILRTARIAAQHGAQLIVFPELALSGYPPEDLVLKRQFLEDTAREIERLVAELPPEPLVVLGAPRKGAERARNSAFLFQGGALLGIYDKLLLPNYGVFDEQRIFEPGDAPTVVVEASTGWRVGLHICEDSWVVSGPACRELAGRVHVVVNLSGSPYHRGKLLLREQILRAASASVGASLAYCNLVGGQDELVFDGASMVVDEGGVRARARQFEEDILYADLVPAAGSIVCKNGVEGLPSSVKTVSVALGKSGDGDSAPNGMPRLEPTMGDLEEVYSALALGLRDYTDKNGFREVVLGLSGGIDSALVATIAADALGPERVNAVTMPSRYSSLGTRQDAREVASNLGIRLIEQPIERLFQTFLEELTPLWPGRAPDITEENIQARIRGIIVMALSNKFGWLVLTTGNKSELATGYCTLYGDMAGGFALIKDVPKTLVFELARWRNARAGRPLIPESILTRPPSAELRENQTDQDTLPPYDVLDGIIERYVERDLSADAIVADGFDPDVVRRVIRMIDANEYKRRQGAPGVKITPKAFGRDRRLPITNLYRDRTSVVVPTPS
ncbi:MAG: NAD+ synthase [Kiritimatiellae bacterium]|nr:NAD+ synthase [Kiritimatiellia bacterium]MDW8457672.1 NAD+ synthase [Verrucomicrobiota bacterium]